MENKDKIMSADSPEEFREMKNWLFRENVRIEAEKKKLDELYDEFYQEKHDFEEYQKTESKKLEYDLRRLNDEKLLFEKKLLILQNAYEQLDIDRQAVEREKRAYHVNKEYREKSNVIQYVSIQSFFRGVDNVLALKKRYKDLIKIFHPDNLCGDKDTVQMINQEYNSLRKKYQC